MESSKKKSTKSSSKSPRVKKASNTEVEVVEDDLPEMPADVPEVIKTAAELVLHSVTVFPDRAELVRQLSFEYKDIDIPGYFVVRVNNVSLCLDEKSVRCEASRQQQHDRSSGVDMKGKEDAEKQKKKKKMADVSILEVNVVKETKEEEQESDQVKQAMKQEKEAKTELRKKKEARSRLIERKSFLTNYSKECTSKNDVNLLTSGALDGAAQFIAFYDQQRQQIDEGLLVVDQEIEVAEELLKKRRDQLKKARTTAGEISRTTNTIVVTLYVHASVERKAIALDLAYILDNAGWSPTYDCRVSSEHQSMQLTARAKVVNSTGEHWDNCTLLLSSATPSVGGVAPELKTLKVKFEQPHLSPASLSKSSHNRRRNHEMVNPMMMSNIMQTYEVPRGGPEEFGEDADDGLDSESEDEIDSRLGRSRAPPTADVDTMTSNVDNKAAGVVNFRIPRKASIGFGEDKKVTIAIITIPVSFSYTVVPEKAEAAFLRGTATNNQSFPLLAGEMMVFIDNSFLARSNIKKTMPGGKFSVFLGVDDAVVVKCRPDVRNNVASGGFFSGKTNVIEMKRVCEVSNSKSTSIMLNLFQQLPLSESSTIKVKIVEPSSVVKKSDSQLLPEDQQDGADVLLNEFNNVRFSHVLEPGQTKLIKFVYQVEYPKEKNIYFE